MWQEHVWEQHPHLCTALNLIIDTRHLPQAARVVANDKSTVPTKLDVDQTAWLKSVPFVRVWWGCISPICWYWTSDELRHPWVYQPAWNEAEISCSKKHFFIRAWKISPRRGIDPSRVLGGDADKRILCLSTHWISNRTNHYKLSLSIYKVIYKPHLTESNEIIRQIVITWWSPHLWCMLENLLSCQGNKVTALLMCLWFE